ncbi:RagB/SusD family nutrient uptake outer membrane protein [Puteibacter caeruleilacunae]|nr:RagB/SusD family nutrient uptake outer membrane protein [Puteibacter caeruleilacunae]
MNKLYLLTILVLVLGFSSCQDDILEKNDPTSISSVDVWKDPALVEFYVNGIYYRVPGWNYNTYNNITDEARSNYPGGPNSIFIGQWNETNNSSMDVWASSYKAIRVANDFFANIETASIDEDLKKQFTAEVKFLRAFFYFDLVKRYGGVPLIKESQSIDDDLMVARNTTDECFAFIISELDEAVNNLPTDAPRGKASKGAALALKSRVTLYYASPLFNEGADNNRWQTAANAAKAVMDLNKYDLYPDLKTLWLDESSSHVESIFEKQYKLPNRSHGWDALVKPLWLANGDCGQCSPLQELVNAFPMKNGKLPSATGSGFDSADPYSNRDKRFYSFIAYNGATVSGAPGGKLNKNYKLNIYKGGADYDSVAVYAVYNTVTSYFTVKATNPDNSVYSYGYGSEQPWIEFRYAEVLLNYAEALNEAGGSPTAEVYAILNKIRSRAGIENDLVAGSLSKEEMRELIRNERYVELCFEGKRYWDLRRWKIAHTRLHGKKFHGAVITKNTDGTFTYDFNNEVDPTPGVFEDKMYLMPIPKSELTKNPSLTQNPGWTN